MTHEKHTDLYRAMLRIRLVEQALADAYPLKEMRCPVHLSVGQEATAVGLCAHLELEDHVYSNHRCHAHYLAKGGDLSAMVAELFGKATGCCRGKGGSMHLAAPEVGMIGSSALVGGTIPIAVGSALSFTMGKTRQVSVAFLGDGATEEGIFYESLNFAALKKLPVIFACENNLYATYSSQKARQSHLTISERALAFNMPGETVDGNDVESVYESGARAVERARNGQGPTLLELRTYRWKDHVGPDGDIHLGYRSQAELDQWMEHCPIARAERLLFGSGALSPETKQAMVAKIEEEIEEAFSFARQSPVPTGEEMTQDVYARNPN